MNDATKSNASLSVSGPSDSRSPNDTMNCSNASYDRLHDKVDRIQEDPQCRDAQLEGELKASSTKKPPSTQLLAASALTSLKPDSTTGQELKEQEEDSDFQIPLRFTKSGRQRATPFPIKLMKVLSIKKYSHIITWTQDGKSFTILRPKVFASEILPNFFKESKYSSFTRKLHRWGFQRHLRGSETASFYNKNFQQGRPDLLDKMTCYKQPRESNQLSSSVDTFASMSQQDALMLQASLMNQAQRPMMPSAEMIAEAQAIRMRQQLALMQQIQTQQFQVQQLQATQTRRSSDNINMSGIGGLDNKDHLNAAIELEVARRLQDRVQQASLSRQALAMMQQQEPFYDGEMQASRSFPESISPAHRQEMSMLETTLAARVQQAHALRLAVRGYQDANPHQYFDPSLEGARGA